MGYSVVNGLGGSRYRYRWGMGKGTLQKRVIRTCGFCLASWDRHSPVRSAPRRLGSAGKLGSIEVRLFRRLRISGRHTSYALPSAHGGGHSSPAETQERIRGRHEPAGSPSRYVTNTVNFVPLIRPASDRSVEMEVMRRHVRRSGSTWSLSLRGGCRKGSLRFRQDLGPTS